MQAQEAQSDASILKEAIKLSELLEDVCWVLPLTKREKLHNPFYIRFRYVNFPETTDASLLTSVAILSQLRLVDAKRFRYKIGTVHENEFAAIQEKVRRLIA